MGRSQENVFCAFPGGRTRTEDASRTFVVEAVKKGVTGEGTPRWRDSRVAQVSAANSFMLPGHLLSPSLDSEETARGGSCHNAQ